MSKVESFGQVDDVERLKEEIGRLEDRVKRLTEERDEERELVTELREHVREANEKVDDAVRSQENWIEAFEMVRNDEGNLTWAEWVRTAEEYREKYYDLVRTWNRHVDQFNEHYLRKRRPMGRPLQASQAQCEEVINLRREQRSLAEICDETNLSKRTVRTIIGRHNGTDRTTRRHIEHVYKIPIERKEQVRYRARKRTRDRIPDSLDQWLKSAAEFAEAGRDLLKR